MCITIRSLLPKDACVSAFPCLVALLGSELCVVHSYAAVAVERLLSLREGAGGGGAPRFTPQDLGPFLQPLLERLFAGFALPDSSENEYLMKAVMRVIGFVGPAIAPVSAHCLQVRRVRYAAPPRGGGAPHARPHGVQPCLHDGERLPCLSWRCQGGGAGVTAAA
jgi:hypothetical protein